MKEYQLRAAAGLIDELNECPRWIQALIWAGAEELSITQRVIHKDDYIFTITQERNSYYFEFDGMKS